VNANLLIFPKDRKDCTKKTKEKEMLKIKKEREGWWQS
jgi:hypothetical protein